MTRERRELRRQFAGRMTPQETAQAEALARAELALKTQEDNTLTQASNFALGFLKEIDSGKLAEADYDQAAKASSDFLVDYFAAMSVKMGVMTSELRADTDEPKSPVGPDAS